jgi:hypothetical protein
MRGSYVVSLIAATCLAGTACSLLTDLDGYSGTVIVVSSEGGGGDANGDANVNVDSSADTSPIADAGQDEAGPNIHPQGTFEGTSCDPWVSYQGTLERVDVAHSGSGACRVCTKATTTDVFTGDDGGQPGPAIVGATYRARGWVRTAPSRVAPGNVALLLRSFTTEGGTFTDIESQNSGGTPITATWTQFATELTITKPGGTLNVYVAGDHVADACFLMDDIVVQRLK